ncbi:serine hydrolase domain-containing protein [Alkalimonas amylolytica]|uniref:CubicO group peptidase, beta-lactamase class C family n=1 Tax=Alkalimonas amylolytica TaxID=152573 RepID=A0A1H4EQ63_ALKAM|nr:serine hydrolase domain-containing protein [Alkalimonas amylolytica]SEA87037.1 CubicO group peptidase, beta-lactamase class C family [Alkalimonas amylolytica]
MKSQELLSLISELADELEVPGVAVGLWHKGTATYACYGITSIDNPLPINEHTLFQAGSIGKNFTATLLMLLATQGRVELDAPVRDYLPDLELKDKAARDQVTLRQLLNHTAGWEGDFFPDTGDGDEALMRFVERMKELEQWMPPGAAFSYNNAAFCLAGRVIEVVTGVSYEVAVSKLLLEPLGLRESFFFRDQVMTRRFVVGHKPAVDGILQVARPWALPRNGAPAGGIVTSITDLLSWARFHLGDLSDGYELPQLTGSRLAAMRKPTVHMPGCGFGDAFGIGWFLSKVGGSYLVSHGGSTNGQEANLSLLPEHNWALALLTNSSPGGLALCEAARTRVLSACTGLAETEARPASVNTLELAAYEGEYRALGMHCQINAGDKGKLLFTLYNDPELLQLMTGEEPVIRAEPAVLEAWPVEGYPDRYVFASNPIKGITGYFDRSLAGQVQAVNLFGRRLPKQVSRR